MLLAEYYSAILALEVESGFRGIRVNKEMDGEAEVAAKAKGEPTHLLVVPLQERPGQAEGALVSQGGDSG